MRFYLIASIVMALFIVCECHVSMFVGTALLKTKKSDLKAKDRTNEGHNKSKKIQVSQSKSAKVPSQQQSTDDIAEKVERVEPTASPFDLGSEMSTEMLSTLLYMAGNYFIFRFDFSKKGNMVIARGIFCVYIFLTQLLLTFLRYRINTTNDLTILPPTPSFELPNLDIPGMDMIKSFVKRVEVNQSPSKGTTVKDYDLVEVTQLSRGFLFEIATVTFMHFYAKAGKPLLFVPLMGITNKIKAPIVRIHLFGMKAVGSLARPFKSGLAKMLEGHSMLPDKTGDTGDSSTSGPVVEELETAPSISDSMSSDTAAPEIEEDAAATGSKSPIKEKHDDDDEEDDNEDDDEEDDEDAKESEGVQVSGQSATSSEVSASVGSAEEVDNGEEIDDEEEEVEIEVEEEGEDSGSDAGEEEDDREDRETQGQDEQEEEDIQEI